MIDLLDMILAECKRVTDGQLYEQEKGELSAMKIDDSGELPSEKNNAGDFPFILCRIDQGECVDPVEKINIHILAGLYVKDGGRAGQIAIFNLLGRLKQIPVGVEFGEYSFDDKIKWQLGLDGKQERHNFYVKVTLGFERESDIFSN